MQDRCGKNRRVNSIARGQRAPLSGARVLYAALRVIVILGLSFGAFVLSVIASVWGLTAVLVGAALVALVALRIAHSTRTPQSSPGGAAAPTYAGRARRAFVITGVVVVGFFVLLTLASQILVPH
jgi:hypothetical protein